MTHTPTDERTLSHLVVSRTLAAPASFTGITLFTGVETTITLRPAAAGEGIVFRRVDLPEPHAGRRIPANVAHVVSENRRTVLAADPGAMASADPCRVQTVEHLLAALAGLSITDVWIDVAGPEIPIGDGSARPFVEMIREVGTCTLAVNEPEAKRTAEPIVIREPIILGAGDGSGGGQIAVYPAADGAFHAEYHLDYGAGSPLVAQHAAVSFLPGASAGVFVEQILPARTFCLEQEAMAMRRMGLFHHLTPAQMLVIGDNGPIDNSYRFADEPARHKLLDVVGDLVLVGRPIIGRVVATRSGHALNHALARAIITASKAGQ